MFPGQVPKNRRILTVGGKMDAARGHRSIFPYDGMIRIRFTGESAVSLSLSRIGPTPRRINLF